MANEKLKEALHYVIARCDDPSRLGATRLNKIMWYADSYAYRKSGASITADAYVKRQYGPVPKHVLAAIRELQNEKKIATRETPWVREFFATEEVRPQNLSEEDREILDSYARAICDNFSAAEISNASHDQIWEAAELGEEIPLYATFAAQRGAITQEAREWATKFMHDRATALAQ